MMENKKILGFLSLVLISPISLAMQPLDDQALSKTTGQDGINIGVQVNNVQVSQVAIIDNNGLSSGTNYKNKSSLIMAGTTDSPVTVSIVGATTSPVINAAIDTDGNSGKPLANMNITLGQSVSGIKVSPFALYLADAATSPTATNQGSIFSGGALKSSVKKLLTVGSATNNFEIAFHNTSKPSVNIQLGNVPQGYMMMFSGAIQSVCGTGTGCPINIISDATSASFDFQVKATDATNGFRLNGFHAGVESGGLVFGNFSSTPTASDKLNVSLTNMTLGTVGQSNAAVFNGMQNGSMGTFGAIGASVTNLKMTVKGF